MIVRIKSIDILWNYLSTGFLLLVNVLWLPLLVYYMSPEMMGVWYIFVSIGGIADLFDLGFSPQISRTVAYSWSGAVHLQKIGAEKVNCDLEPNYELLYAVMKTCKSLYLGIALLALVVMITGGSLYIYQITIDIENLDIYIAWIIYVISIFMNLYIGYYTVVLRGIGDLKHMSQSVIMAKLGMVIVGSVSLVLGYGILGLALTSLLSGFIQRYLCRYYLNKYHRLWECFLRMETKYHYTRRYIIDALWHNAWRDGLVTIASYFNRQLMILICGSLLTLAETGIFSLSTQIIGAILGIASGMSNSYIPSLQSAYAMKNKYLERLLIARSVTAYYLLSIIGIGFFVVMGVDIIQYIKSSFVLNVYLFILLSIHLFLLTRHQLSASYISTMNQLPYTISFIVSSVVSVFGSWIAIKYLGLGIYGLVLGPMVTQSIYNNWKWNLYINSKLDVSEIGLLQLGISEYYRQIRKTLK